MAKVFTSIYRHLQLFTADKILLANKSTPGLKQSIHENKALLSVALRAGTLILVRRSMPLEHGKQVGKVWTSRKKSNFTRFL